jgi:hypothetical protein
VELAAIVVACVALAALSALLPTVPSYDPWSWIVWGREVSDPHLGFVISGGPSWKPLPFIFTTVWGLIGGAAPTLWVITARAGGLLGLVAAYRLASVLVGRMAGQTDVAGAAVAWRWAGPVAGVLAAAAVVLTRDTSTEGWTYYMFRGTSEPMLIAACLWAVDRHLAGRRGAAFFLLICASLIRPETWPFLALYGIWIGRSAVSQHRRLVWAGVLLGWASIPLLWFVPPWAGSGQPFLAASHAKSYNGHLGADRFLSVLGRGVDVQLVPVLVLAVAAVGVAWWRRRDLVVVGLAVCALAWWVIVVGMTLDGYPGLQRFYLPAAAVTCVLGGAGIVALGMWATWAVQALAARRGRMGGSGVPAAVGAVVVALLVAVCVALGTGRISNAWAQRSAAAAAVHRLDDLSAAVSAAGGHSGVFPCKTSVAAVNHGVQTALAWKLHVTLERVGTSLRHSGVDFVGPHDAIDGQPAPVSRRLTQRQTVARVAGWDVTRVYSPGADMACVGR